MGKAQAKARLGVSIKVLSPKGKTTGTFRISTGGIDYYKKHAREVTIGYTWKQLARLFMKQLSK